MSGLLMLPEFTHTMLVAPAPPAPDAPEAGLVRRWRGSGMPQLTLSLFDRVGGAAGAKAAAVVLWAARQDADGWALQCLLGFCDGQDLGDELRERGVRCVDAKFEEPPTNGGSREIRVQVPFFVAEQAAAVRDRPLLVVSLYRTIAEIAHEPLAAVATLESFAPDPVQAASMLATQGLQFALPPLACVRAQATVEVTPEARFPDLPHLLSPRFDVQEIWYSGPNPPAVPRGPPAPPRRRPSAGESGFGVREFEFDDVQVIGFRLDLGESGRAGLAELIRPLNFHLREGPGADDYRYEAATATVVLELLRYGRMRSPEAPPPLTADDYTAQHELLVRVLVGRVDDDTAQARDPAVYVASIFVDDPWSKLLGREFQGFPKDLAWFCTGNKGTDEGIVLPDGMVQGGAAKATLGEVVHVRAQPREGGRRARSTRLLDVRYVEGPPTAPLRPLAPGLFSPAVGTGRWRQADIGDMSFRRSFARDVLQSGFGAFSTVQFAPVDNRLPSARALVRSRITSANVQVDFPSGPAVLTLTRPSAAPMTPSLIGWAELVRLLGGSATEPAEVTCLTGEWYRLSCDLKMRLEES